MGNSFSTTAASASTGITIAEARTRVRESASNAGDTTQYTDAMIDRAIQFAGTWLCRETKMLRGKVALTLNAGIKTITLTASGTTATATSSGVHGYSSGDIATIAGASDAKYNITAEITVTGLSSFTYTIASGATSPPTGTITSSVAARNAVLPTFTFRPDLVRAAWIEDESDQLEMVDWGYLQTQGSDSGTPELLAFYDGAHGIVYPYPPTSTTLNVQYSLEFPYWTPGGTVSDMLLPTEYIFLITDLGAPAKLQFPDPSKLFTAPAWQVFLTAVARAGGNVSTVSIMKQGD